MIGLGLGLLAPAVADLIAGGLSGVPRDRRHGLIGIGGGIVTVAVLASIAGLDRGQWVVLVALAAAGTTAWVGLRLPGNGRTPNSGWALAAIGGYVAALVALSGGWAEASGGHIADWLGDVPVPLLAATETGRFLVAASTAAFLLATGNGIVRGVLAVAGTEVVRSEQRLRGGRAIGAIERLLIFGLALAGEPTAAAFIVAAKSILRFPELSRAAQEPRLALPEGAPGVERSDIPAEVDLVTEYFLLGSLTSWALALAPALLL